MLREFRGKKMRVLAKIWVLGLAVFITPAFAALDLELTQGMQKAMPIAVVPFAGQNDAQAPDNIATVVSDDLGNSGRFKVLDQAKLQQFPHNNQGIDTAYWQKLRMNNLVVGSVTPASDGRYQVNMQLLDPFDPQNSVLMNEQFVVNKNDLRSLAHHISDLVYQKLTGDRGIFSTRIAYVVVQRSPGQPAKYALEVADVDGYNPRPLLTSNQPLMSPAWSPNGKSIAYVSFESDQASIYVQDVATGNRRLVTKFPGINGAPAWSPDGSKLAVVLTQTGYPKIYIVDLATSHLTQVTDGYSIDTEPSFAPDGRSLLFTSNRGGGPEIYRAYLNGGQIQRLTYNSDYNARAAFIPDGSGIIMLTQNGGYNIAVQDLATGRVTLLTNSGNTQSPSVAPNGKMVVFADQYQGRAVLGMVSTDGSVKLRLPAREGEVREPAWSPFLG